MKLGLYLGYSGATMTLQIEREGLDREHAGEQRKDRRGARPHRDSQSRTRGWASTADRSAMGRAPKRSGRSTSRRRRR